MMIDYDDCDLKNMQMIYDYLGFLYTIICIWTIRFHFKGVANFDPYQYGGF